MSENIIWKGAPSQWYNLKVYFICVCFLFITIAKLYPTFAIFSSASAGNFFFVLFFIYLLAGAVYRYFLVLESFS